MSDQINYELRIADALPMGPVVAANVDQLRQMYADLSSRFGADKIMVLKVEKTILDPAIVRGLTATVKGTA